MPEVYQRRFVERQPNYRVPNGESLTDRFNRVKNFLEDVVSHHHGGNVVVVTHGGIIDDLFRNSRCIPPQQLTGLKKPYGSLSILVHGNGAVREEVWGGIDHLPQVVAESPSGGQLYLFPHQVAGSFPMLRGDLGELCKPAVQREWDTYKRVQKECPQVAKFVPVFTGEVVIDVKHIIEKNKSLHRPLQVMHMPNTPPSIGNDLENFSVPPASKRNRPENFLSSSSEQKRLKSSSLENCLDGMETVEDENKNGWTIDELWDRFINYRNKKVVEPSPGKYVYLIMDNLTHGLSRPHVMDLKMGTQQFGREESPEKVASKIAKVESTTSKTLGARIAGYQLYNEKTHKYVLKNKYWGRSLDDTSFYLALVEFVKDQSIGKVRRGVVKDILTQLDGLMAAIKSTCWKFYGCSVLIVYDGNVSLPPPQTQDDSSLLPDLHKKMDLLSCTEDMNDRLNSLIKSRSHSFDGKINNGNNSDYSVAVRLIDFAKTEWDTDGEYDTGLVFGIRNLCFLFRKMLFEASHPETFRRTLSCSIP